MGLVSIRDLRNHGGEVIDRVHAGEKVTITRSGKPVAVVQPIAPRGIGGAALLDRWRHLPHVDPDRFRADVDAVIDATL